MKLNARQEAMLRRHYRRPDDAPGPVLTPLTARAQIERRTRMRFHITTFYRWLRSGKLWSMRCGGRIGIPDLEVDRFVDAVFAGGNEREDAK